MLIRKVDELNLVKTLWKSIVQAEDENKNPSSLRPRNKKHLNPNPPHP